MENKSTDWNVTGENDYLESLEYSLGFKVVTTVIYSIILVAGLICNSIVILVVIKRPRIRTVTNTFIMNLAVADLLVMIFCVPLEILSNLFSPVWIFGLIMCKVIVYFEGVSVSSSAYFLGAIALDRLIDVYYPLKRPPGLSKRQSILICFTIWLTSLLLSLRRLQMTKVIKYNEVEICVEVVRENTIYFKIYYAVVELFCGYILPLLFISVSSLLIWHRVSHREIPQELDPQGNIREMHDNTRHRVGRSLAMVILSFSLSWLPFNIVMTILTFCNIPADLLDTLDISITVARLIGFFNSSLNPVLYAFFDKKFRELVISVLREFVTFPERNPAIELNILRQN